MKVFRCGTLIDGTGAEPVDDGIVVVEDGVVSEIGPADVVSQPPRATTIEHANSVVIPGLIDAHVHVDGWREHDPMEWLKAGIPLSTARATADLEALLEAGFTTVRDVGSRTGLGLKRAVSEGTVPGPRIYTSDRVISQTAGHGDLHFLPHDWISDHPDWLSILADGEAECRKAARKLIRKGVDCLKIMTSGGVLSEKDSPYDAHMTDAEIRAVTEEAHRVGIPVASHAEGAKGIESALRNGVDTIEHGFGLNAELVDLFKEREAIFVPTMAVMEQYVQLEDELTIPEYAIEKVHEVKDELIPAVRLAADEGLPIALGTDFSGSHVAPHGENALEAILLSEDVGMSAVEVIEAGTSISAETIPDGQLGALTPGNYADLVVLNSNPVDGIEALRDVKSVYKDGELVAN